MKIAIPLFGDRVSPRFDCASKLLIATVEKSQVIDRKELFIENFSLSEKLLCLVRMGVNVLICGAIDDFSREYLMGHQIKIRSWVAGEVSEILRLFLSGDLKPDCIMEQIENRRGGQFRRGKRHRRGARWNH